MTKAKVTEDDFNEAELFGEVKAEPAGNPLAKYFRVPGIHVKLPTGGRFMPKGSIEFSMAGDVPVYPMRAADEILMKSPDALMSGYAIEKMLESCVPAIKLPRQISTPDLDVLLLAVRAASYGETMEIETTCPNCGNRNHFQCSLPHILATVKDEEVDNAVRLSKEVVVSLRPYTLDIATRVSMMAFGEARKVQAAEMAEDETVHQTAISESFRRLTDLNLNMLSQSVIEVVTPQGPVRERPYIAEFIANAPAQWIKKIEDKLKVLNNMGMDKTIEVQCVTCEHLWKTEIEFDPTSFFGQGS